MSNDKSPEEFFNEQLENKLDEIVSRVESEIEIPEPEVDIPEPDIPEFMTPEEIEEMVEQKSEVKAKQYLDHLFTDDCDTESCQAHREAIGITPSGGGGGDDDDEAAEGESSDGSSGDAGESGSGSGDDSYVPPWERDDE